MALLSNLPVGHLSRLSPVMWALPNGYPRREMGVPISMAGGMGAVEQPTVVVPRGQPLWSNLYRIGTTGAISKVQPYGPAAFSGMGDASSNQTLMNVASFLGPFLLMAGAVLALSKGRETPSF